MNLADCYRLLGLRSGASFSEVKASYRRLARQYHPDANSQDGQSQEIQDKFIQLTEAYKTLLTALQETGTPHPPTSPRSPAPTDSPKVTVHRSPHPPVSPPLSETDQKLKRASYEQLQQLLKQQRFPRAIALVEGLGQRFPQDIEVQQWQAITYQRWGRHLIENGHLDKARVYLKKALRTDPHNKALWAEVERDFRRIEKAL